MPDADAVLEDDQGRSVLRFERVLRHAPERVWQALTEPGELGNWHPTPYELEPAHGCRATGWRSTRPTSSASASPRTRRHRRRRCKRRLRGVSILGQARPRA